MLDTMSDGKLGGAHTRIFTALHWDKDHSSSPESQGVTYFLHSPQM